MADNINTSSATTTTMSSSSGAPTSVAAGGAGGGSKFNNNNHNKNHNNTSSDVLKSGSNKHGNVIHRTTSESLRLGGDNNMNVNTGSSAKNSKPSKTSSFQITSVTVGTSRASGGDNGDDSADDLDTDDNSRITDVENETPSFSEDTFSKEDVFFSNNPIGTAPVIPTSSQYGLAIVTPPDDGHMMNHNHNLLNDIGVTDGGSIVNLNANLAAGKNASDVDLKELSHRNERFKVVKIESTEPFKRGRWVCMDYLDHTTLQQSKQEGDGVDSAPQSHGTPPDKHSNNLPVTRDSGVVVTDNNIDIESMPNSATHIQNDMSTSSPVSSATNQSQQHHQNHHQNMEVGSVDSGILNNGTLSSGSSGEHVSKQNHHAQSMINIPVSSTTSNVSSNVPMQQHTHHPQTLSQFNLQKVITTQQNDMPQTPPPQQQQQQLHPSTTGTPLLTSPAGAILTNHAQGATLPSNLIHNIGTAPNALQHQLQSQQNSSNPHNHQHHHHHQNHQAMSMVNISLHDNSLQSHQSSGAIASGNAAANQNQIEQQQQMQSISNTPNNNNNNNNKNNISHTPDGGNSQQYIQPPTSSLSSQSSLSISPSNQQSTSLPATMTSGIGTPNNNNNNNNNNNTVLNQEGQIVSAHPTLTTTQTQPNTILNNNLVNEINEIAASTIFKTIDDGQLQQQISTALPGGVSAATEESTQPTEDGESLSELALALSSTNTKSNYGNDVKIVNNSNNKMQFDGGDASHQSSQGQQQPPHQHHHHHHHHHHRHGGAHHSKTPEPITNTTTTTTTTTATDSNKNIFTSIALGNCIKNLMNTAANPNNSNVGTIVQGSEFPNKSIQNFIKEEIKNIPVRNISKVAGGGGEQMSSSKLVTNVAGGIAAPITIGGGKVVVIGGSGSASRSTSPQPVSTAVGGNCSSSGGNCETASASGTSAVAIDNKIEQAMDLVKSHLMFAVREEVEVLKEKIAELMDRINQLEIENTILKANATQETLSQLSATVASSKVPPANPANGPVS